MGLQGQQISADTGKVWIAGNKTVPVNIIW